MPQKVLCSKCGKTLYEGLDLKPPDEIIKAYDGNCPGCGKKLGFYPENVEIRIALKRGVETTLPQNPKNNEQKYRVPPQTLTEEPKLNTEIEHDFLFLFNNTLNVLLRKFKPYLISQAIGDIGGRKLIRNNELYSLFLSLDNDDAWRPSTHAVKRDFKQEVPMYVERKTQFDSWKVVDLRTVSLEERIEYEERLKRKIAKLVKILERNDKKSHG